MTATAPNKLSAFLELFRFPNIFTALADILAGYLIVKGTLLPLGQLLALMLSSACIYAAGCALNDIVDLKLDNIERPFRPIPSGRVSKNEAILAVILLLAVAVFLSQWAGIAYLYWALLLISFVLSYDLLCKNRPILGPLNMGACRAANLALGMAPALTDVRIELVFPLLSLFYVFSLTFISRYETGGRLGYWLYAAIGGLLFPTLFLTAMIFAGLFFATSFIYLGCFLAFLLPTLIRTLQNQNHKHYGNLVKYAILALPILGASYSAAMRGWVSGIPVILCLPIAFFLSRRFYVT